MNIPVVRGLIERRILVNYRVEPEALAAQLPAPFRPHLLHGAAMVGICLIRLKQVRPVGVPAWLGIGSENAAHRMAVEWPQQDRTRQGVYVQRRDTSSRFNAWAGGRLFPGLHQHATFQVQESPDLLDVSLQSDDGETRVSVRGRPTDRLPSTSAFATLEEASTFFEAGSLGYSATNDPARFQGLELRSFKWRVEPLEVEQVRSSFFEDRSRFPHGSIRFDSALLMRNIPHEWHGKPDLCCSQPVASS